MSFQERRSIVEQWVRELVEQENRARQEREAWQAVLLQLDKAGSSAVPADITDSNPRPRHEPGRNAQMVQMALERAGKPQPINFIARELHDAGLLTSQKGYKGVYAIVSTIVRRNPGKRFVQMPNGWWDLTIRFEPLAQESQDDQKIQNGRPDSDFTPDRIGAPVDFKSIARN